MAKMVRRFELITEEEGNNISLHLNGDYAAKVARDIFHTPIFDQICKGREVKVFLNGKEMELDAINEPR